MGTQLPSTKKGQSPPQFSAYFYCGQTAGCIKMPLGMEVRLNPGDCFRWGPTSPPKRHSPQFSAHVCCVQNEKAGWIKRSFGTKIGLDPGDIVLDWDPAPPNKGHSTPTFRPVSTVAKRSPISATAKRLYLIKPQIL